MTKKFPIIAACLIAAWSTPGAAQTPAKAQSPTHRELPAVRKMLDAAIADLKAADGIEGYGRVYDALSKIIALDPKSRRAFAARGETVRRALRLQNSMLAEDDASRKELISPDGALRDFDKATTLDAGDSDSWTALIAYGRGRIFLDYKKDARRALAEFTKSIAANARFGSAYLGRALAAGRLPNPNLKTVFDDYDKSLQLGFSASGMGLDEDGTYDAFFQNQTLSTARHGRGLIYALRNENEKALADLNGAIEASLLNVDAIFDRGKLHAAMNEPQKAIQDFSALVVWRPNDPQVYRLRAAQYSKLGEAEKAFRDLERVADLTGKPVKEIAPIVKAPVGSTPGATTPVASTPGAPPTSADAQKRGDALMAQGKLDEAVAEYSRAVELDSKNAAALSSRGWALARMREYARAASDFDAALKLRPADAELFIARGQMRGRVGQADNAVADFQKATELAPNNIAAWEQWGVVLQANGKYADAATRFQKAVEIFAADADAPGQETTLAALRLAIVRAAQKQEQDFEIALGGANVQQLRGAVGILEFEIRKQPDNEFLKTLRDKMQTELQKLQ